mgnify:CR=1 FL=1
MKYPKYCIMNCPIGLKAKEKFMLEAESISDAVIDMWNFIDECVATGCEFEKEKNDSIEE